MDTALKSRTPATAVDRTRAVEPRQVKPKSQREIGPLSHVWGASTATRNSRSLRTGPGTWELEKVENSRGDSAKGDRTDSKHQWKTGHKELDQPNK